MISRIPLTTFLLVSSAASHPILRPLPTPTLPRQHVFARDQHASWDIEATARGDEAESQKPWNFALSCDIPLTASLTPPPSLLVPSTNIYGEPDGTNSLPQQVRVSLNRRQSNQDSLKDSNPLPLLKSDVFGRGDNRTNGSWETSQSDNPFLSTWEAFKHGPWIAIITWTLLLFDGGSTILLLWFWGIGWVDWRMEPASSSSASRTHQAAGEGRNYSLDPLLLARPGRMNISRDSLDFYNSTPYYNSPSNESAYMNEIHHSALQLTAPRPRNSPRGPTVFALQEPPPYTPFRVERDASPVRPYPARTTPTEQARPAFQEQSMGRYRRAEGAQPAPPQIEVEGRWRQLMRAGVV